MPFVIPSGNKDGPWSLMAEFAKMDASNAQNTDRLNDATFRQMMGAHDKEALLSKKGGGKGSVKKAALPDDPNYEYAPITPSKYGELLKLKSRGQNTEPDGTPIDIQQQGTKFYQRIKKNNTQPQQQQQQQEFINGVRVGPQSQAPLDLIPGFEDVQYG